LVLLACSASDGWRPERLYFRHTEQGQYQPIGICDELVSQEFPFVHPSKPLLAYVLFRHEFTVDEQGEDRHSGSWHALQVVSLESGAEVQSVDEATIRLPAGTVRGWVCEIVSFGDSGLCVKAALSSNESSVEYFIAELDASQNLKPVAALPAVFM
jgi:hypothetical protein